MKNYINNLNLFIILTLLLSACNEEILDKNSLDSFSDPLVWSDINLAKSYLSKVYDEIEYGIGMGEMLGAMTDELLIARGGSSKPYNLGNITADNLGTNRGHINWGHYKNIHRINFFLSNIYKLIEEMEGAEKIELEKELDILRGEALFLRAWEYHTMMRSYGGLILISEPFSLGDDFLEMTRSTFEETINFIVSDCNEAASLLKLKSEMEMGRATKEAALSLKSRVLLFAASDLTADGTAESDLVGYKNIDRTALWTTAKNAAKAVIDLGTCELSDFGAPNQEAVANNYFALFKEYDLSNNEIIWGRMFLPNIGKTHSQNRTTGPNGNDCFGRNGPLQNMIDSYEMEDGSKFTEHFSFNSNDEYINISTKFRNENPYYNREPRFYASILYDSAMWQPRFKNLAPIDPLGIYDRRTRRIIENGEVVFQRYGLDTRQGPHATWNGNYSGYLLKKFQDDQIIGRDENNKNIWIFLRYAEILLNYAESSLELGEESIATEYINKIRNRAGMPDFTGDITEALRYERKIELFAEDIRWYDIRRWKILEEALGITPYGIDITEITNDGVTSTTWKRIRAQPDNNPVKKMYWIPIDSDELRRAPQLVQNPGY
jgi:starch-binding outer membrane protein, SusD/RagB family